LSTLPGSFAGHLMSTLISLITPSTAILASASLEKHE